jgi:hypothetical protein
MTQSIYYALATSLSLMTSLQVIYLLLQQRHCKHLETTMGTKTLCMNNTSMALGGIRLYIKILHATFWTELLGRTPILLLTKSQYRIQNSFMSNFDIMPAPKPHQQALVDVMNRLGESVGRISLPVSPLSETPTNSDPGHGSIDGGPPFSDGIPEDLLRYSLQDRCRTSLNTGIRRWGAIRRGSRLSASTASSHRDGIAAHNSSDRRDGTGGTDGVGENEEGNKNSHSNDWELLQQLLSRVPAEQQAQGLRLARRLMLPASNAERHAVWSAVRDYFDAPGLGLTAQQRERALELARELALPARDPRVVANMPVDASTPSEYTDERRAQQRRASSPHTGHDDRGVPPHRHQSHHHHHGYGGGHGGEPRYGLGSRPPITNFSVLVDSRGRYLSADGMAAPPSPPRRQSSLRRATIVRNLVRQSSRTSRRSGRSDSRDR